MFGKKLTIFLLSLLMLTGCGVKQMLKGEYYLSQRKYKDGILAFKNEVNTIPDDSRTHYYLGRLYLADGQAAAGLTHLKKAVNLDATDPDHHFWLGVAYAAVRQKAQERKCYLQALTVDPNHLQSRIYLAHSQLEGGEHEQALANYQRVLKRWPDEPASLYNRALALQKLGRKHEERGAWKEYLDFYSAGPMSRRAVAHLNRLGDFSYRNHLIGPRTLTLRRIAFKPTTADLTAEDKDTLRFLGAALVNAERLSVHIVAFSDGDKSLAEKRAKAAKKYLLEQFPQIAFSRIKVAWFGEAESIRVADSEYRIGESVNFITATEG